MNTGLKNETDLGAHDTKASISKAETNMCGFINSQQDSNVHPRRAHWTGQHCSQWGSQAWALLHMEACEAG